MIGRVFVLSGLEFEVTSDKGKLYGICVSNLDLFISKTTLDDALKMGDAKEKLQPDGSWPDPRKDDIDAEYAAALANPKS